MKHFTRAEWAAQERAGRTGEWTRGTWEFRGRDFPESHIGRKTWTTYEPPHGTVLWTEGEHFTIEGRRTR